MFLVVDQHINYQKPINPFQRYDVEVSAEVSNDKWIHYTHVFQQHAQYVKPNAQPVIYAIVKLKAVVKEKSGKTIRPSEFITSSEADKAFFQIHDENPSNS